MPDSTLATISASEAAALFNVSPWVTRWMLWQRFAKGMDIDAEPDARMNWGTKLEPLILDQAGDDMRLEVRHNRGANGAQAYFRNGLFGCHRDGDIICPDRGPGAIECKCVFDYRTWMTDWNGGKQPPRHVEIQLQTQMKVGDGHEPYRWGVVAAWVAGEQHYFEREPVTDLYDRLDAEAAEFFASIKRDDEPNPFGSPVEVPLLKELFPLITGKVVDLSADVRGDDLAEAARAYKVAKEQESAGKATAEPLRAALLAVAKDADEILLPGAISVRIRKSGGHGGRRVTVWWPDAADVSDAIPHDLRMAG